MEITQEYLKERLDYDPLTGIFVWKWHESMPGNWNSRWPGQEAGNTNSDTGYIFITLLGHGYGASRLAWLYVYGEWPHIIDHHNTVRDDNRIVNLRNCSVSQNRANSRHPKCCVWQRGNRFITTITVNGDKKYLGCFKSEEEARQAYIEASALYYGEFSGYNRTCE